jgi:hypothetical protein
MGSSYEPEAVAEDPVAVENEEFSEGGTVTLQDP